VIYTLLITLLIEGMVVLVYSAIRRRPAGDLLQVSFIINIFTQTNLWVALRIFFRYYLIALIVAEVLIWLVESVLIHRLSRGQLSLSNAGFLSLCMNLASFGIGWFLPL
jgi:hypothetical protein